MRRHQTSAAALAVLVSGTALAAAGTAQAAAPEAAAPKPHPAAASPATDLLSGLPVVGGLTKGGSLAKSGGNSGLLGGLPLGN